MSSPNQTDQIQTKITFLLQKQPLFQITTHHPSASPQSLKQILLHIMKTIHVSHKQNAQDIFTKLVNQSIIYGDKQLVRKVDLDSKMQRSQGLFYNFSLQEYDFVTGKNSGFKNRKLENNNNNDDDGIKKDKKDELEQITSQNINKKNMNQTDKIQVVVSKKVHIEQNINKTNNNNTQKHKQQQQQHLLQHFNTIKKKQQQIKQRQSLNSAETTQGCCQLI